VSAQKVATAVVVTALAALFLSVGLPRLLPPPAVPEIVVPVGDTDLDPARLPEPSGSPDNRGDDGWGDDDWDDDDDRPGYDDDSGPDDHSDDDSDDDDGWGAGDDDDSPDDDD
jgi:hypothetical protein